MHASQMKNAEKFGGFDLVKLSQIVGAYRGMQSRVEYAEAFRPVLAWPRVRTGNALPT